ncbi:MAG: ATP-dependent DNA helicase RecG, partial [Betaproteobacteria bacterium]|nr:ATP-dependent DNA helicase RecG [Betaproteobacteria bacterium]
MSAPATPAADRKPSPLLKLGLRSDLDLCLHLPLRYEDETQLTPIGSVQPGTAVQVEGTVQSSDIVFRPRRQLVVTLTDGTGLMVLRFFNFYGSQQKALAVGARVRARGEARYGHHVLEIVHPSFNAVEPGTPLKQALTPVYPSAAGISQAYLRKAIANALQRTALPETLPAPLLRALAMPTLAQALAVLHHPGPDEPLGPLQDRTHPAWLRLKIEELVAQQLSHTQARRARASRRAPRLMPARAATPA